MRARLRFGYAHASQLRIDEKRVGHEAIRGRRASLLDQIRAQNAEIVVRNVRERRTAFYISQRVDTVDVGLQFSVHLHEASLVYSNSSSAHIQAVRVGRAACGGQQVRALHHARFLAGTHRKLNASARFHDAFRFAAQQHLNPILL